MEIILKQISKALRSILSTVKQVKTNRIAYQMLKQKHFGVNQVNHCSWTFSSDTLI